MGSRFVIPLGVIMSDATPNTALAGHSMAYPPAVSPSTIKVEKNRAKSTPVRNPAFREHEGLRNLQKQLNSQSRPQK